jgi:hypothetical protein
MFARGVMDSLGVAVTLLRLFASLVNEPRAGRLTELETELDTFEDDIGC